MLLSEIIYNIKNLMAGGIESDDTDLSNAQMAFIVAYYRAKLLKQDQDKGRMDKTLYVQNLGKVPLVQADKNECCDTDACILRTQLKIPTPLETYKGMNITFVGTLHGRPFQREHHNSMFWASAAKWVGKEPKWYYQNGYIYLVNPPSVMLSDINIQGIFEKPEDAVSFRTCDCPDNNEDCFRSFDFEYPLPQHHVDTIVKLIAQTEMKILTSIPVDTANNSINQLADMLRGGAQPNG
jgi:hypothetical protein